jgi:hypothetical protein
MLKLVTNQGKITARKRGAGSFTPPAGIPVLNPLISPYLALIYQGKVFGKAQNMTP